MAIPAAIIGEAVLSFLGLGVAAADPVLGRRCSPAPSSCSATAPWLAVCPGVAIVVVALAFNLLGDGLRDALDPRETP